MFKLIYGGCVHCGTECGPASAPTCTHSAYCSLCESEGLVTLAAGLDALENRLSHAIDNRERLRTQSLRSIQYLPELLTDALNALDAGRTEVVREFIERTRDALRKTTQTLRDAN